MRVLRLALMLVLLRIALSAMAGQSPVDLLIKGGSVVDGSGSAPFKADVGIKADRIAFIGDSAKSRLSAARVIDASGLVVAPGFIDPHTHTVEDLSDPKRKSNVNFLTQGVTTVITG